MNRRTTWMLGVVMAAALAALPAPVAAHHGSAVSYDISKQIELTGTVTEWVWKNPHCFIMFDVAGPDGKPVNWGVETHPIPSMIRNEVNGVPVPWSATTLKPGDKVTVTLFPSRVGAPRGLIAKVVTGDGKVLIDDGEVRLPRTRGRDGDAQAR